MLANFNLFEFSAAILEKGLFVKTVSNLNNGMIMMMLDVNKFVKKQKFNKNEKFNKNVFGFSKQPKNALKRLERDFPLSARKIFEMFRLLSIYFVL